MVKINEQKSLENSPKNSHKLIDSLAYFSGVAGNIAVVPQLVRVWQGPAPGMAVLTWLMFTGFGLIWLFYAIAHNQKPLIFAQVTGLTVNTLVVIGWLVHNLA